MPINKGDKGDPGTQGRPGAEGRAGTEGRPGTEGQTGQAGQTGQTGQAGQVGLTGETGLTGQTGLTGGIGLQGKTGVSGQTGPTGVTGTSGAVGLKGDRGRSMWLQVLIVFLFSTCCFLLVGWRSEVNADQIEENRLGALYDQCIASVAFLKTYNENQRTQAELEREESQIFPTDSVDNRRIGEIHAERAELWQAGVIPIPDCGDNPR